MHQTALYSVEPRKKSRVRNYFNRWESPLAGYLFLSPWLIGFFLLTLWPMVLSVYYSFTDYSLMDAPKWVGMKNYSNILVHDSTFLQSIKVTFQFVLIAIPLKLIFALLVAMLLNKKYKAISLYRTMIYFPSLIGTSVAVSVLWRNIFSDTGFINRILGVFGIEGSSWITNPKTALGTLIILVIWQFGSAMIIFLAGLKQIPQDLYEASSVDGAGKIRQFFRITLPMLSPILLFNLVQQIIGGFQMFTQAFIITKGGPINSTYVYVMYLYDKGFAQLEMGYASALAWILLIIIAIVTVIIFGSTRYWVFYESEGGK